MQLILNQKSKYGNFALIPAEGWQLRSFIDYTSGLLVVTESLIDLKDIPTSYGVKSIPTKQYIIHAKTAKILDFDEWKHFFNYEEEITWSEDGQLKEVWQRIHNPDNQQDSLEGRLEEVKTGKILMKCSSVAFRSDQGESLIARHYKNQQNEREWQEKIEKSSQTCPHCGKKVMEYARYPHYICAECAALEKLDEKGQRLEFYNTSVSGGFEVHYFVGEKLIQKTDDEFEKICFIEGKKYLATEARFGGIVIEKFISN
jgi:hypothetical protein